MRFDNNKDLNIKECIIEKDIKYVDNKGIEKILKVGRVLTFVQQTGNKSILRLGNKMFLVQNEDIKFLNQ